MSAAVDLNQEATKMLLDALAESMINNSNKKIRLSNGDGLQAEAMWSGLSASAIPGLQITLIGLSPLNWEPEVGPYIPEPRPTDKPAYTGDCCPDCGKMLIAEASCSVCKTCGFSKC